MNPRPKTICPGFYILILEFKIGRHVSSKMDAGRYSLKNSTATVQTSVTAVLQSRRPALNLQEGCQEDGSCLKQLQRIHNHLRLRLGPIKGTSR